MGSAGRELLEAGLTVLRAGQKAWGGRCFHETAAANYLMVFTPLSFSRIFHFGSIRACKKKKNTVALSQAHAMLSLNLFREDFKKPKHKEGANGEAPDQE